MSQENMDIVREGYERFVATGELAADLSTDDFVWDMSNFHGWPEQQVYEGVDGTRAFISEWLRRGRTGSSRWKPSTRRATRSSLSCASAERRKRPECRLRCHLPRSSRSAMEGSPGWICTRTGARPSKPLGCRASRFGRKTAVRFSPDAARSRGSSRGRSEKQSGRLSDLSKTHGLRVPLFVQSSY